MSKQPNQHGPIDLRAVEVRPRKFLRRADCAADLNSSRNHIRNIIKAGKLIEYELDGLRLILAADWDRYLETAEPINERKKTNGR